MSVCMGKKTCTWHGLFRLCPPRNYNADNPHGKRRSLGSDESRRQKIALRTYSTHSLSRLQKENAVNSSILFLVSLMSFHFLPLPPPLHHAPGTRINAVATDRGSSCRPLTDLQITLPFPPSRQLYPRKTANHSPEKTMGENHWLSLLQRHNRLSSIVRQCSWQRHQAYTHL
jgi:hypothetical protein